MKDDYKETLDCSKKNFFFVLFCVLIIFAFMLPNASGAGSSEMIAYSRLTEGYWQIWVRDMPGSIDEQLTGSPVDKREPHWSQDGKKIVYRTNNGEIYVMDIDGKNRRQVLSKIGKLINPAWGPDNTRLAFVRHRTDVKDDSDIWISDVDGKDPLMLTNETGMQYMPAWSPDGTRLLYVSGIKPGRHKILVMDLESRSSRDLTDSLTNNMLPDWSPDGQKIVFASKAAGNFDIWTMDSNGKNLRQLTKDPGFDSSPSWSSDGRKIVFVSNRDRNLQLWTVDVHGGKPGRLTHGEIECRDPAWRK